MTHPDHSGEMSSDTCQYASTREALNPSSPNFGANWCSYFADMEGIDTMTDMHGAHIIATAGFANFHLSHAEIFNAGQPRLARYPIHWHHAHYVGVTGGYEDPSSAEAMSIHDSFSRFVTVHATHEAIVKNNVGYNCIGHGYFLEDGFEINNHIIDNLGVLVKPGIILPSERHHSICTITGDGYPGKTWNPSKACAGLSVFWLSNIQNFFDGNAAVGGHNGIWSFTHTNHRIYAYQVLYYI